MTSTTTEAAVPQYAPPGSTGSCRVRVSLKVQVASLSADEIGLSESSQLEAPCQWHPLLASCLAELPHLSRSFQVLPVTALCTARPPFNLKLMAGCGSKMISRASYSDLSDDSDSLARRRRPGTAFKLITGA